MEPSGLGVRHIFTQNTLVNTLQHSGIHPYKTRPEENEELHLTKIDGSVKEAHQEHSVLASCLCPNLTKGWRRTEPDVARPRRCAKAGAHVDDAAGPSRPTGNLNMF